MYANVCEPHRLVNGLWACRAYLSGASGEERKPLRGDGESAIQRPDPDTAERCRDEKVNVNPSDAAASEAMSFDKL
jgi:hypothetical protein